MLVTHPRVHSVTDNFFREANTLSTAAADGSTRNLANKTMNSSMTAPHQIPEIVVGGRSFSLLPAATIFDSEFAPNSGRYIFRQPDIEKLYGENGKTEEEISKDEKKQRRKIQKWANDVVRPFLLLRRSAINP